jgi:hypothetical protein
VTSVPGVTDVNPALLSPDAMIMHAPVSEPLRA